MFAATDFDRKTKVHRVFIGLGSNVGNRSEHLARAREALTLIDRTQLIAFSDVFETAPVGPVDQGAFLNAAAELSTELEPIELLDALRDIEAKEGREPESKRQRWGPRTLDLDILLFGNRAIETQRLHVPHPSMHERRFVLEPLADIAPDAIHPTLAKTIAELVAELNVNDVQA